MTNPLHSGQCACGGLMAAVLARKGYAASPDVFEHDPSFFNIYNRLYNCGAAAIVVNWCNPYDIANPGGIHVGAEVKITQTDGREYSARLEKPLGRTAQDPIAFEQMKAKFENCASRVLAPQAVAEALRMADAFENVPAVREFTAVLESSDVT